MIEGVFGTAVREFSVFIFDQHVGFGDGERAFGVHGADNFDV